LLILGTSAVVFDQFCLLGNLFGEGGSLSSCGLSGLDLLCNVSACLGNSLLLGTGLQLELLLGALLLLLLLLDQCVSFCLGLGLGSGVCLLKSLEISHLLQPCLLGCCTLGKNLSL